MSEFFHEYLDDGAPAALALDKAIDRVLEEETSQKDILKKLDELTDAANQDSQLSENDMIYIFKNKLRGMEKK